ncbi:sarcoplasmic reticulum histidine-rich calcium-binding protein-like [Anopheles moucheti]|uniref:sarcoplasmic reticulum histidine-rich calcium-binding protein-like n=1 Tax=Anopheles moucheti TaxID=186751 RepID=UPI0022F121AD|nr:sarcoplasmic reticulum histidine-rich calcium-binding protein-like [Anopheles moucheti]
MAKQAPTILPEFHGETDDWKVYQEILDEFYRANGIAGNDRVPVLISVIGKTTYATLRSLCHPAAPKDMTYEMLCGVLARQFIPEIAIFRHRALFYRAEQHRGESVKEWYARLKTLSMECKFDESVLEPLMVDRFVVGLLPGPVQNRLYEEQADQLRSIDRAVTLAATKEAELRQENRDEEIAHGFAGLVIDDVRYGRRHRRHGKHPHPFGRDHGHGRHGGHDHHRRHGRHHRHHHSDQNSPRPLEHHGHHHEHHGHHGHHGHHHGHNGHHGHHGHQVHPGRHFGPPTFGPGPWTGGHHGREMPPRCFGPAAGPWMGGHKVRSHPFGYPAMMEGFGRHGRPCGKWRKRNHHHRRSSSSSSSSSTSTSSSSDSSNASPYSGFEVTTDQEGDRQFQKFMRREIAKHCHKRHGPGRRYRRHHHHQQDEDEQDQHGKRGCRRNRKQQDEPSAPSQAEQASPNDPSTDPELIE